MGEGLTMSQIAERNAQLVTENAALQQKLAKVVAENVVLKDLQPTLLMVSAAHKELEEYDNISLDDDAIVFLWQAMRGCQEAPTTDAIINALRAEGVEIFASALKQKYDAVDYSSIGEYCSNGEEDKVSDYGEVDSALIFAAQLRNGVRTK